MFKKTSKQVSGEGIMGEKKGVPSIISRGLTITGNLVSDGELQIDGRVEGDIHCVSLVVGLGGEVVGEVHATALRLHGQVTGQVRAESVFLAATARMVGDVHHQSLAIEPGAFLQGMCRRSDEVAQIAAVPSAPAEPEIEPEPAPVAANTDSQRLIQGKPVRGLVGVAS